MQYKPNLARPFKIRTICLTCPSGKEPTKRNASEVTGQTFCWSDLLTAAEPLANSSRLPVGACVAKPRSVQSQLGVKELCSSFYGVRCL